MALPYRDAVPSHFGKPFLFLSVTLAVAFYLSMPEVGVGLGQSVVLATLMSMPEAAVDKHHCAILAHYNVGTTGQAGMVQPIAKSSAEQVVPHYQLRLCILAVYRRHTAMALLTCHLVHCRRQRYTYFVTFLQECYYVQYYLLILYHIYYTINMNLYHYYVTLE